MEMTTVVRQLMNQFKNRREKKYRKILSIVVEKNNNKESNNKKKSMRFRSKLLLFTIAKFLSKRTTMKNNKMAFFQMRE
jgi:hypothetical protein